MTRVAALVIVLIDLFYAVQTVDAWCLETGQNSGYSRVPALASSIAGKAPSGDPLLSRCQYPAASGPEEIGDRRQTCLRRARPSSWQRSHAA